MPVHTQLAVSASLDLDPGVASVAIIGRRARLDSTALAQRLGVSAADWSLMLKRTAPGDSGASTTTWVGGRKVVLGVLPEVCSRTNSPSRAWAIPGIARRVAGAKDGVLWLMLDHPEHAFAACMAAARGFPLHTQASGKTAQRTVELVPVGPDGAPVQVPGLGHAIAGRRLAARLVDAPPNVLHTDQFVAEAQAVASQVGAEITVIQGTDLRDQGFGGLWGVGQAATHGPAFVVLQHTPPAATRSVAWVGKGIVYDTGGLSIKSKTGMPSMKGDMGGAAAVLGAFQAAVLRGIDFELTAILCLAENSVGPDATRPDDVLHMYSGKTVEVNNTDAEGRLVLADGVAWAARHTQADLIVDLATLTGAQLVAVGKTHAGALSNDAGVEQAVVSAGLRAGEPCFPLVYAPELQRKEFKSQVADMKNSVKDRANAQSSCAGTFIESHLPTPAPRWLHLDIAGPSWSEGRGTGYGVGLLLTLGAGPAPG